jgi:predicted branched-subunit amino acid permease
MSPRAEFAAGAKAEAPILLGVLPFGLIYGVLALQAGIPPAPALAMSSIVFAGSAQFVGTQLFAASAPDPIILLTTFVVNLRHLLYSASVAPFVSRLRPAWKALLAYLLTDEAYAVTIIHYTDSGNPTRNVSTATEFGSRAVREPRPNEPDDRHWFSLGAGLTLWVTWQASTAAGVFLAARIPASWGLEFALPLTFVALVRSSIIDRGTAAAALMAGIVAVLAHGLVLRLGIIVAAAAGIATGMLADRP